jgi:hypothetical protein
MMVIVRWPLARRKSVESKDRTGTSMACRRWLVWQLTGQGKCWLVRQKTSWTRLTEHDKGKASVSRQ